MITYKINKTLNVKIIDSIEENQFSVGGHEIEISSIVSGVPFSTKAFVNNKKILHGETSTCFSGLFKDMPFTSEFIKDSENALREAFKKWSGESSIRVIF